MKFDIKNWLIEQSLIKGHFVNSSGNGKFVPEYELKNGELKLLKNKKTGEVITHNLYNDIQSFAHVNDYLKILKDNPNALDSVKLAIDNGKIPVVNGFDYSKLGSFDDLVQASQKLKDLGYYSFDDIISAKKEYDKKMSDLNKLNDKKDEFKKDGDKKEGDK